MPLGASVHCSSGVTGTCWYMLHWLAVIKNAVEFALSLQHIDAETAQGKMKLGSQVSASVYSTPVSHCMQMLLRAHRLLSAPVRLWFTACQIGLVSQGFEGSWVFSSACWSHYTSHVCCHPHWIESAGEAESVHMGWWLKQYLYWGCIEYFLIKILRLSFSPCGFHTV